MSDYYQRITLHLGAHRTGSSTLQAALFTLREDFQQIGVDIIVPRVSGLRDYADHRPLLNKYLKCFKKHDQGNFLSRQLGKLKLQKAAHSYISFAPKQQQALILSEENILGKATIPEQAGILYPEARRRLLAMRSLCGPNVTRVVLSLRNYADFLLSYEVMQQTYAGSGMGQEMTQNWASGDIKGWPQLCEQLSVIFPQASIEVWPFRKFDIPERLVRLAGEPLVLDPDRLPHRPLNAAPTKEALEALASARKTRNLSKEEVDSILAKHSSGNRLTTELCFSNTLLDKLNKLYRSDCDAIVKLPSVIFVP